MSDQTSLNYILHFKDGTTELVETRIGFQLSRAQNALHRIFLNNPSHQIDLEFNGKILDYCESQSTTGQRVHYQYPLTGHPKHNKPSPTPTPAPISSPTPSPVVALTDKPSGSLQQK
jgi:hypothetical protein